MAVHPCILFFFLPISQTFNVVRWPEAQSLTLLQRTGKAQSEVQVQIYPPHIYLRGADAQKPTECELF